MKLMSARMAKMCRKITLLHFKHRKHIYDDTSKCERVENILRATPSAAGPLFFASFGFAGSPFWDHLGASVLPF